MNSLGVGTAGSGTAGEIRATNNVTAYYSDDRFKTNLGNIPDALAKVMSLNGFYYEANELAQSYGYEKILEVGVSAQQVQAVQPMVVAVVAVVAVAALPPMFSAVAVPVQFVSTPDVGVPSKGVTNVGLVANTADPVPVSSVNAPSS